ncbi:hypothetical protein [Deinococcus peraridilitoris]|uniref:Uncharacterized protein n=1 Tax=Deinococcus peraridilitoris (strain DSM 19664 / LMG 22246 / CIP 109416 / KR-200) TaxID=937777 RepID=L0A6B0_DEIPD|nr:hypothetical protein [Deinococcus peraridilitoris]AFZ68555.1 hypothetical protein Deipe_3109 [Deinococcus peraridilitoris DSM 19664]
MTALVLFRAPRQPGELWRRRRNGALIQFVSRDAEGRFVFDNLTERHYRRTSETVQELREGDFAADYLADSLHDAFAQGLLIAAAPDTPKAAKDALLSLAVAAAHVYNAHGKTSSAPEWTALAQALEASLPWTLGEEAPAKGTGDTLQSVARELVEGLRPLYEAYVAPGRSTPQVEKRPERRSVDPQALGDMARLLSELLRQRK